MNEEDKIKLLKMAISCLREPGETKPVFSADVPTKEEIDIIKKSLENEKVDEKLLKKFFPMAYDGVNKHGFLEYFFFVHNDLIRKLERYTKDKLFDWCTAYPAKIVDKVDSKYVVETVDGRIIKTDSEAYPGIIVEKQLKIGNFIILHRDKIHMILNKEDFEIISKLYKKFKEHKAK